MVTEDKDETKEWETVNVSLTIPDAFDIPDGAAVLGITYAEPSDEERHALTMESIDARVS